MAVELGASAFGLLIAIGALSGVLSLWAFRRWSDGARLRLAVNRVLAHLMEFQLFAEEPALIFRAQRDLLLANARFLRLLAVPSLLLVLPFAGLMVGADAFFGRAPLPLGKATVITLQCRRFSPRPFPETRLEVPPGMDVETDPVRVATDSQISWRIRPRFVSSGEARISCNGRVLTKTISARPGLQWLSERRSSSVISFLFRPLELPFSDATVQSIALRYPAATVFHMHWSVWFSAGSLLGFSMAALTK